MSQPTRVPSQDSADGLRKRVCKACDRCRLKKSKCDGSNPCTRCRADNAICVFGQRKKSHDKVYPKGYVEMLEQQQTQLIAGLQETYRRMSAAQIWPGDALHETEGHPLTHDILARLGILSNKDDAPDDNFEEDCNRLQQRLISQGAALMPARRGSVSSDSDHSQTYSHKRARSTADSPIASPKNSGFRKSFDFDMRKTKSPQSMSPVTQTPQILPIIKPSPLHTESSIEQENIPIDDEVLLTSWDWQNLGPQNDAFQQEAQFQMPPVSSAPTTFDNWQGFDPNEMRFDNSLMNSFANQTSAHSTALGPGTGLEWQNVEVDFSKFVQVGAT